MNTQFPSHFISEIYLLAMDGVWRASVERHSSLIPIVERVANRLDVTKPIGPESYLKKGTTVGISQQGFQLYFPFIPARSEDAILLDLPEEVDADLIGEKTGAMLGLFLTLPEALAANSEEETNPPPGKLFGYLETKSDYIIPVLQKIGEDHPVFVIARHGRSAFPDYWYEGAKIARGRAPHVSRQCMLSMFKAPSRKRQKEALPVFTLAAETSGEMNGGKIAGGPHRPGPNPQGLKDLIDMKFGGKLPEAQRFVVKESGTSPAQKTVTPALVKPKPAAPVPGLVVARPNTLHLIARRQHAESGQMSLATKHAGATFLNMGDRVFLIVTKPLHMNRVLRGYVDSSVRLKPGEYEMLQIHSPLSGGEAPWWIIEELEGIVGDRITNIQYMASAEDAYVKIKRKPL